jgi:hypothetical protein
VIDDRAARQSIADFLSEPGSGDSVPPVPADAPRQRNLRATFREPSTGFPGTRAFSPRRADSRAAGATVQSAAERPVDAPAHSQGSDDSQGRRTAVSRLGAAAAAIRAGQSAAKGAGGGRVRGRRGAGPSQTAGGSQSGGKEKGRRKSSEASGAEGLVTPIADPIPIGTRVTVIDPSHPRHTYAGSVISVPEKYGLGWVGQRVDLDGNNGETFIRPEQTDWKPKAARRSVALPAAIQKLVPKSDEPKSTPKLIPTENERASATRLFREIGQRFNENRKKSKTAAYAGFRHDLMDNLDTLVMGGAIDLKEATSIITNLEQYTKETEAESTETPATILGRWLRMDAAEVAGLSVGAVEEAVEDDENSGEEIDELDAAADPLHAADSH